MSKPSFALAAILLLPAAAAAVECPAGVASCKVLTLSPQEEAVLTQPGGVLATAAEARKVDYSGFVQYFIQRIKEAPAGEPVKPPPAADAQGSPPPPADQGKKP